MLQYLVNHSYVPAFVAYISTVMPKCAVTALFVHDCCCIRDSGKATVGQQNICGMIPVYLRGQIWKLKGCVLQA